MERIVQMKGLYTRKGYILGARCDRGHGGNRRYAIADSARRYAECAGCRAFVSTADLPRFASRADALAADAAFRATWPEDSAERVLRGDTI